jgi:uncharacterized protein YutE (UPF0331/DUF86 family)
MINIEAFGSNGVNLVLDLKVIKMRLDLLDDNVSYLNSIAKMKLEEFATDQDKTRSARYALQVSIEACLDIGNHIIAGLALGRPANYKDVFAILGKNNIVSPVFAQKILPMAKFRNRLVHIYWEVDNEDIYKIMQNDLEDLVEFARQINQFIAKH